MDGTSQVRLGIVGFGEVGSALGRGLRQQGLGEVIAYDKYATEGAFSDLIQRRAREADVVLVDSLATLASRAGLILAVTPGTSSVSAAESLRAHLASHHIYVDLAATTFKVKEKVGVVLEGTGARLADGAIMGSPLADGYRVPILASGPGAQEFRDAMAPWGMRIELAGEKLGVASGIKSLRSVYTKAHEAILVETALASARYGIQKEVFASIARWMDSLPFMDMANLLITTAAIHAERRANEADMSVDALMEVGVEPTMIRAGAQSLRWLNGLKLKEHFGGVVPERYEQVVEAIEGKLRAS